MFLTFRKHLTHFEEGSCKPDYARFIKLAGDCCRERQQSAELEELSILLLSPVPRRVLALVLHDGEEGVGVLVVQTVVVVSCRLAPGHNTEQAEGSQVNNFKKFMLYLDGDDNNTHIFEKMFFYFHVTRSKLIENCPKCCPN